MGIQEANRIMLEQLKILQKESTLEQATAKDKVELSHAMAAVYNAVTKE